MMGIRDANASEKRLRAEYLKRTPCGPILVTCTGEYHRLTLCERLRMALGLTTLRKIDRYFTKCARYDARRRKIEAKLRAGKNIRPELWLNPRTNRYELFTSEGTIHHLSYLDRLLHYFGQLNIAQLNEWVCEDFEFTRPGYLR